MPNRRDKDGTLRMRVPPPRYRAFTNGTLSMEDLDDQEVARMQLKDKDGHFRGRPPASLPREFMLALQAENQRRMQARWQDEYDDAMAVIHELMMKKNPMPGDKVRLDAANMVIERLQGKAIDRIEVKATISKFDEVAGDIIMDLDDPKALGSDLEDIPEEDDL